MLVGRVPSSPLLSFPVFPKMETKGRGETIIEQQSLVSLAAGFEHFATGYMRSWGRDTFISLRGLLLVTGRFSEARVILLSFASVLRHGLIPNLMDSGRSPRYNCRDAVWWFLQALQDYCIMSEEGILILKTCINRRFPSDKQEDYTNDGQSILPHLVQSNSFKMTCTLGDLVFEIFQKHALGIHFREWNAGLKIDAHMRDEGFTVTSKLDISTGLIFGGNASNCGTWMDKMGSAVGLNQGEPATPRDGAPIEITGLVYSSLLWVQSLSQSSSTSTVSTPINHSNDNNEGSDEIQKVKEDKQLLFTHIGVKLVDGSHLSFSDWALKIKTNFEKLFFVPLSGTDEYGSYAINSSLVNRRGIYKDLYGASAEWATYQLRPNFVIAMTVSPSLFSSKKAHVALCAFEDILLSKLGVKTLDPSDWAYRGDYDNSRNDGIDKSTANGWNYHQGPEWLWPLGYYLRARMHFPPPSSAFSSTSSSIQVENNNDNDKTGDESFAWPSYAILKRWMYAKLSNHRSHMETTPHGALPELTNSNGKFCKDSCVVQAWSSSTLLDALYDMECLKEKFDSASS